MRTKALGLLLLGVRRPTVSVLLGGVGMLALILAFSGGRFRDGSPQRNALRPTPDSLSAPAPTLQVQTPSPEGLEMRPGPRPLESQDVRDPTERRQDVDPRSWEGFYAMIRPLRTSPRPLEKMIAFRLAHELGLDATKSMDLFRMIEAEQQEVSREVYRAYGEALKDLAGAKPDPSHPLWDSVKNIREMVRRRQDADYLAVFGPDGLRSINEHLRNETLIVVQDPEIDVRYAVLGTGK